MESQETFNAEFRKDIGYIKEELGKINQKLDDRYVTKEEFSPVKNLVYGCAGVILMAVVTALVYLVIIK